ncbi:uncharacterized protein LOC134184577 [Corticium candelabrum]|uniref:uncharacterized protein LOC134184577 n=1 Tax=Corticium candelabrum TaxID=121492 RepID=UPI002E37F629|nr:uncharacterized protein LOC134184577 [Corticium candelabrum]
MIWKKSLRILIFPLLLLVCSSCYWLYCKGTHRERSFTSRPSQRSMSSSRPIRNANRESREHTPSHHDYGDTCKWSNWTGRPPFFLTAVVNLRIRKESKSKTTTRELKQWLQYMKYIGVEHVYLYDAYLLPEECQLSYLTYFISEGFITYTDWHDHNPFSLSGTQVTAYQNSIDRFGKETEWQLAVDLDEYPFSPSDTKPGFLPRFIHEFAQIHPDASEITMNNYLFLGKPSKEEFLFQRIWRRTPQPANNLVKPVYRPLKVTAQLHHNYLKSGRSVLAPDDRLRMNHYWGSRLQNWGEDTPDIIAKTQEDRSMEKVLRIYVSCEQWLRKYLE